MQKISVTSRVTRDAASPGCRGQRAIGERMVRQTVSLPRCRSAENSTGSVSPGARIVARLRGGERLPRARTVGEVAERWRWGWRTISEHAIYTDLGSLSVRQGSGGVRIERDSRAPPIAQHVMELWSERDLSAYGEAVQRIPLEVSAGTLKGDARICDRPQRPYEQRVVHPSTVQRERTRAACFVACAAKRPA